ncbi:hypothetical protein [Deinococcus maricopensis]|uniref:hypothetical protein n=1 Tax=Deinococcus maricopensis TaxID=309887 RepID=UPI0002E47334|nr:hypothetical protein [Deinococcus maricopensis]
MTDLNQLHADARHRLDRQGALPGVLRERGLSFEDAQALDLGLDAQGNVLLPLRDEHGTLIGLKGRVASPAPHKYFELPAGNGNPPWYAPTLWQAPHRAVLWVEGELNAMVTHLALRAQQVAVIGLGSAFGPLDTALLRRLDRPGYLYLDDDTVGRKSARAFLRQAEADGVALQRVGPLLGAWDACTYAHTCGQDALRDRWLAFLKLPSL